MVYAKLLINRREMSGISESVRRLELDPRALGQNPGDVVTNLVRASTGTKD